MVPWCCGRVSALAPFEAEGSQAGFFVMAPGEKPHPAGPGAADRGVRRLSPALVDCCFADEQWLASPKQSSSLFRASPAGYPTHPARMARVSLAGHSSPR